MATLPPLKILFLGAGEFALPTLEKLASVFPRENLLVVSQPPRAKGRGRRKAATPVSDKARELGLEQITPKNINHPESQAVIRQFEPDYLVLVDFGTRLEPETIALPKKAAINLHPSLLPAFRGPAPMAWALIKGEPVTGVTTQLIGDKIDCGHILLQDPTFIRDHETLPELSRRLGRIGAPLVTDTIEGLESGELEPRPQNESLASQAPKLKKEDGLIDWNEPAANLFNRIRGLNPWPGTYTFHRGRRLKILKARVYEKFLHEQLAESSADRKAQVGSGDRSERIRTYNYPQNRITDHRIGLTLYRLNEIMEGGLLDEVIEPLIAHFQAEAIKAAGL